MGSIVKDFMAKKLMINPNEICHVSIMPCYDKKLEASRQDFYNDLYSSQDVDLVLSTLEVEQILLDKNISIHQIPKTVLLKQPIFPFVKVSSDDDGCLALSNGSSSGGYLEWVLRYAVKCLYNTILTSNDIQQGQNGISIISGRNADFTTITYTPEGYSEPTLKFAYVYGFKNIQNLVRKLKVKRSGPTPFHFVEVMACPQGCINGGAQSRDDPSQLPTKEWIQAVQHMYSKTDRERIDAGDNAGVCNLLSDWLGVDYVSQMEGRQSKDVQRLFHTRFHAVENNFSNSNSGLLVKW
jgi:iron only hydrogenase large subunit-like protein